MATSGVRNEDNNMECVVQWPLQYVNDTKEYMCGWCGQAFVTNHTTDDLEVHFKSCRNSETSGILMNLKGLQKMYQTSEMQTQMEEINTEVGEEKEIKKTEFEKKISDLKSDLKKDLRDGDSREASDEVLAMSWHKLIKLEKIVREMGVAQEAKMSEVIGRVNILEAKGSSSAQGQMEAETIWAQLRNMKTQQENALAEIKTGAETFLRGLNDTKSPSEGETSKQMDNKNIRKSFHPEPSLSDQFATQMTCFSLISRNYLLQPSFKCTINGIAAITEQNTFELTSEPFQLNGYPVQARVKFQLKKDGCVYMSLCMKNEGEAKSFSPIPQVFYFLIDKNTRKPTHTCHSQSYLSSSVFNSSLHWELCFVHKSWLQHSTCNVNDSVEIEIYMEPFIVTQYVYSYNGILEWKMENYAKRLRLERKWSLYFQESPYFYTGPNGFRVQVRMYLKGAEGKRPTARIMFFTGLYDAALLKSFPHSTTVALVNPKDPLGIVKKAVVKDVQNEIEYMFEIFKNEEVKNLIENDALFCKVVIKAQ